MLSKNSCSGVGLARGSFNLWLVSSIGPAKIVYGGRTFLRRILDAINTLVSPLQPNFSSHPRFFEDGHGHDGPNSWQFLMVGNYFWTQSPVVDVQTDACYEAAGVFFHGDWGYYNFFTESPSHQDSHINYKKVLAVIFAAELWALWEL